LSNSQCTFALNPTTYSVPKPLAYRRNGNRTKESANHNLVFLP
jgi:hypothetical protein